MVALSTLYLFAALAAGSPDAVLLEFYSPSCGPCQSMQITIDRLKKEGYPIQQINVETAPDVARQFQIRHVPTCVLVVAGKEVTRLDGVRSRDEIEAAFAKAASLQQAANQVTQQAEELVVRGQSPEGRRGLGLFNKLSGRNAADPGAPPMNISAGAPAPVQDNPFAQRAAATMPSEPAAAMRGNDPPEFGPSAGNSQSEAGSPQQRALAATVRLKVEDPQGVSFGTGTIIDSLKDEALVVTCGHIFRESKGQGKILVDLHVPGVKQPVTGQLISFDLTRDIALVSIRPGMPVTPVEVASDPRKIVEGTRVFSIGCDGGREPSIHENRVLAVDKYVGSPNYTVGGAPVQGRSGGGLFSADGQLIGICNGADTQDDEGLYQGLGTIHWQLDQIGQTAIYQKNAAPASAAPEAAVAAAPRNELPVRPAAFNAAESTLPTTPAMNQPTASGSQEIIFFVRDKNQPSARGEAVIIENPTPELMDAISRAARGGQVNAAALSNHQPVPASLRSLPEEEPTIVRGQSRY